MGNERSFGTSTHDLCLSVLIQAAELNGWVQAETIAHIRHVRNAVRSRRGDKIGKIQISLGLLNAQWLRIRSVDANLVEK